MTNKRTGLLGIALVLALVLLLLAPAAAHHKSGHENGGGPEASETGMTEDNDTNDNDTPNNVEDEGDNAHPSGNDRSIEHGHSGNQGSSTSDPDDDTRGPERTNGGVDKADGPGGADLADQDGNNGCGNDDDFEDDNEGWCSKRQTNTPNTPEVPPTIPENPDTPNIKDDDDRTKPKADRPIRDEVLTLNITPDGPGETAALAPRSARSSTTLPMTGSGVAPFLLAAIGLIVVGMAMVSLRRGGSRA